MFVNPGKKAKTLKKLIAVKKEVRNEQTSRVLEQAGFQEGAERLLKPIVEGEKESKKEVLKAITDGNEARAHENLAITQAIREIDSPLISLFDEAREQDQRQRQGQKATAITGEESRDVPLDETLRQYLEEADDPGNNTERDKVKGIYFKNGRLFLGDKPIEIEDMDIRFEEKTYVKSPELLQLLVFKNPGDDIDDSYLEEYVQMLNDAGLLHKKDGKRQGWKGKKYELIRGTIDRMMADGQIPRVKEKKGGALRQGRSGNAVDVIVGTPEELLDQLHLILASVQAGNTSNLMRNKAIAILDNLYKGENLNKSTYIEALQQLDLKK